MNHTHTSFGTLSVTDLNATTAINTNTTTSSLVVNDNAVGDPVFMGTISEVQRIGTPPDPITYPPTGVYPYEIPIKINGVIYMVPAREYIP